MDHLPHAALGEVAGIHRQPRLAGMHRELVVAYDAYDRALLEI
jgi:hypothetical protein